MLGLSNEDLFYVILLSFYGIIGTYVVISWYRDRGKIRINIKTRLGELRKRVRWDKNKLYIEKGEKGRGKSAWEPTFTALSLYQIPIWRGLRKAWCIDIMEGASKAIEYNYDDQSATHHGLSMDDVTKHANASVLDRIGNPPKIEIPPFMWLSVVLPLISVVLLIIIANYIGVFGH